MREKWGQNCSLADRHLDGSEEEEVCSICNTPMPGGRRLQYLLWRRLLTFAAGGFQTGWFFRFCWRDSWFRRGLQGGMVWEKAWWDASRRPDLWINGNDGRHGDGGCKALCRDRGLDLVEQLVFALVFIAVVGGVMALVWAVVGGFLGEMFTGAGDLLIWLEEARDCTRPPNFSFPIQRHERCLMLRQLQLVLSFPSFLVEKELEKRLEYADNAPNPVTLTLAKELGSFDSVTDNTHDSDPLGGNILSIALICPSEQRRRTIASALNNSHAAIVREYSSYPPTLKEMPRMLGEKAFDAVIIDLESDVEYALELVEFVAASSSTTVMVYTSRVDPNLMVRSMRSGAREFLSDPIDPGALSDALVRASARRQGGKSAKRDGRENPGLSGRKGRVRRHHGGLQLCRGPGAGVPAERGADRP